MDMINRLMFKLKKEFKISHQVLDKLNNNWCCVNKLIFQLTTK